MAKSENPWLMAKSENPWLMAKSETKWLYTRLHTNRNTNIDRDRYEQLRKEYTVQTKKQEHYISRLY